MVCVQHYTIQYIKINWLESLCLNNIHNTQLHGFSYMFNRGGYRVLERGRGGGVLGNCLVLKRGISAHARDVFSLFMKFGGGGVPDPQDPPPWIRPWVKAIFLLPKTQLYGIHQPALQSCPN